jgi:radical SAM enzyme (TIGR01210 family)
MTFLEKLLQNFGERSQDDIIKKFKEQKLDGKIKSKEDFYLYWATIIGPIYYRDSILPISRQIEILKQLMDKSLSTYIQNKASLLKEISKFNRGSLEQPAWDSINFSDSKKGKRLQFGFKNRGCQYWHNAKNKVGCYNCGYFMGTQLHHFIDIPENAYHKSIMKQLDWIEKKYKGKEDFDVVDIEGDGSFFNPWEFPKKTQLECLRRLSGWKNLTHLLVESRPEYIDKDWINELLNTLRSDQMMEIAIGVESTDKFVRTHCINKGLVSISDITQKESIKNILKQAAEFNGRVHIQAYLLVKPAFLSEKEALADAVNSGRVLYQWAKEYYPKDPHKILSLKYEPVVINRGTLLEVLYKSFFKGNKRAYEPLNLWTVAELLVQLAYDNTYKLVRFGAREDMDDYLAIPVVPGQNGNDTVSPIDFRLYHAVQKFCATRSIGVFLTDVEPLLADDSFHKWKEKTGIFQTALEIFIETYREEISENKKDFDKKLDLYYEAIQNLSYHIQNESGSIDFFRKLAPGINNTYSNSCEKVEQYIRETKALLGFSNDWKVEVKDLRCVHDSKYKSVIFKIDIETPDKVDSDLWLSVPTESDDEEDNDKMFQEIERKFIVDNIPEGILKDKSPTNIIQGYIAISDQEEVRVRKKFNPGKPLNSVRDKGKLNPNYILTRKSKGDLSRDETEENISPDFFEKFLFASSGRFIEKDRYKIPIGPKENKWTIELDIFKRNLVGLVSAEVEFKSEEEEREFREYKPGWFGADVTFDRRFKNNLLATQGLTTVLTPYNRRYKNVALFLPFCENASIPPELQANLKMLDLDPQKLPDLVYETSGEINSDVVEVLRSVPLVIVDDNKNSFNLLTKLAVREASGRPLIKLSETDIKSIPNKWDLLRRTDTRPTALSSNLGDYSLSEIVRSQQIVDNEILTRYESKAEEIWVISTTLEFDVGELFNVVYKNLSSGKKYRYFIPSLNSTFRYSETLNRNHIEFWKLFDNFKENIQFLELNHETPSNLKEIVIYDPLTESKPFGFTYIITKEGQDFELIRLSQLCLEGIIDLLTEKLNIKKGCIHG